MGFQKKWNIQDISFQIHKCALELNSPYNDGYTAWGCKKDLYELFFLLQGILDQSPKFSHLEEEYLKFKDQEKIIKILRD